jgi:uncharacterized protein (DUF433 family)
MMHGRIEINPQIMFGKPVIRGTRITVEQILRKLSGGKTIDEILTAHPHLVVEDIDAAVAFVMDYPALEGIVLADGKHL